MAWMALHHLVRRCEAHGVIVKEGDGRFTLAREDTPQLLVELGHEPVVWRLGAEEVCSSDDAVGPRPQDASSVPRRSKKVLILDVEAVGNSRPNVRYSEDVRMSSGRISAQVSVARGAFCSRVRRLAPIRELPKRLEGALPKACIDELPTLELDLQWRRLEQLKQGGDHALRDGGALYQYPGPREALQQLVLLEEMIGTSFLGLLAERGSLKAAIAAIGAAARQVAQLSFKGLASLLACLRRPLLFCLPPRLPELEQA
eukprot:scaffold4278_cov263-Pinguiococcus_pyrenoidosus.AAC.18